MPEAIERKWTLTKIGPGDYLLPSNDGATLWRIALYEDGPSSGRDDMRRDRKFWGVWRWQHDGPITERTVVDTRDWDRWVMAFSDHETRADAIREALGFTRP